MSEPLVPLSIGPGPKRMPTMLGNGAYSNCLLFGTAQRGKREMLFFGETRCIRTLLFLITMLIFTGRIFGGNL